ncbi:MAG: hypothetical protein LBU06_05245 [Desulfovibrio sp.]|jgi:hypothetical protein|nr:hypothetical protein [Desulfovibrio sp.]
MNIGDVVYFSDYEFLDGGHADKLFVVLAFSADKDDVIFVMASSKGKEKNQGCQPTQKKFFIRGGSSTFPKDTWLDLSRKPSLFKTKKVASKIEKGACRVMTTLPPQKVNEIKNCLTRHSAESLTREMCLILGVSYKF